MDVMRGGVYADDAMQNKNLRRAWTRPQICLPVNQGGLRLLVNVMMMVQLFQVDEDERALCGGHSSKRKSSILSEFLASSSMQTSHDIFLHRLSAKVSHSLLSHQCPLL